MQEDGLKALLYKVERGVEEIFRRCAWGYALGVMSGSTSLAAIFSFYPPPLSMDRWVVMAMVLQVVGTLPLMFYLLLRKRRIWYYGVVLSLLMIFVPMYEQIGYWILKVIALVFVVLALRRAGRDALSSLAHD